MLDPALATSTTQRVEQHERRGLEPGDAIEAAADVEMIPEGHRSHRAPLAVHGRHLAPLLRLSIEYLTQIHLIESPYRSTDTMS
jgi:hypothetical protein